MADTSSSTTTPPALVTTEEIKAAMELTVLMREGELGAFPIEDTPEARAEIQPAVDGSAEFMTITKRRWWGGDSRKKIATKLTANGLAGLENLGKVDEFKKALGQISSFYSNPPQADPETKPFPLAEISASLEAETGARIYVAGGLVAQWVRGRKRKSNWKKAPDADLFIVHPDSDTLCDSDLRNIVARAIELAGIAVREIRESVYVSRTARATTFASDPREVDYRKYREIQVVHRVYPSVGQLLADFDHGGCAFGSDGAGNFFESPLGRLARTRGVIVLDPTAFRQSTPFRLIKYMGRELDLVLPGAGTGLALVRRLKLMKAASKEKGLVAITPHFGTYTLKVRQAAGQTGALVIANGGLKETRVSDWGEAAEEFPKYYSDKEMYGGYSYDPSWAAGMRKALAKELAAELAKGDGQTPLGSQYFKMTSVQDFSAYCRALATGEEIPIRAVQEGNEAIIRALEEKLDYSRRLLATRPTMELLDARKSDYFFESRKDTATKNAKEFLARGVGRNGPEFEVGQGILSETEPSDELAESAYTCAGFPYGYEPSTLGL